MSVSFVLEALVVLGCIVMGTRAGGVGVGLWGGLGTFVLVFIFGEAPGDPPAAAIAIILAVVTTAALMQAAGGIDWMVAVAAGVIEKRPKQITLIAPLTAFLFSRRRGDEQHHLPAAARHLRRLLQERDPAVAAADRHRRAVGHRARGVAGLGRHGRDADPHRRRSVQPRARRRSSPSRFPACVVGIVVTSLVVNRMWKDLDDDPEVQAKIAVGRAGARRKAAGRGRVRRRARAHLHQGRAATPRSPSCSASSRS